MIPIGLALAPPAPDVPNALDDLVARARDAAAAGVASLWLGQVYDIDALTSLAVIGREVPGVALGSAVTTTYPRHVLTMNSQAQTVQAAVGGRLLLGVGVSHKPSVQQRYGYAYDRPIRHIREYLTVLGSLLHTGEARWNGEMLTADTTGVLARVAGAAPPPVLLAALGPAMLRAAGELADGVVTWLAGPRTVERHVVPTVTRAAAGRAAPEFVVSVPVCVTADVEGARERAAAHLAMYDRFPAYESVLAREGARIAADVAVIGDESLVERAVRRFQDVGATHFLANPWGFSTPEEHDRTVAVLGALSG